MVGVIIVVRAIPGDHYSNVQRDRYVVKVTIEHFLMEELQITLIEKQILIPSFNHVDVDRGNYAIEVNNYPVPVCVSEDKVITADNFIA